ncbi:hypothetical protein OIDMADRAFT_21120 [Oidiodendron maius Zn]|uniref:Uncharacterized protein n=1 Tax=Oidiodendron maius (strain Zn) TaxID=913774 RepID=A0A0C3GGK4_OIDMZ|nr:hypothetical protein OIDMADRAFT_21120 [Oidiodendron maius Zn]
MLIAFNGCGKRYHYENIEWDAKNVVYLRSDAVINHHSPLSTYRWEIDNHRVFVSSFKSATGITLSGAFSTAIMRITTVILWELVTVAMASPTLEVSDSVCPCFPGCECPSGTHLLLRTQCSLPCTLLPLLWMYWRNRGNLCHSLECTAKQNLQSQAV